MMWLKNFRAHRLCGSGLPTRFASCLPRFALLLDLRKTRRQPTLLTGVLNLQFKTSFLATGMACLPQRHLEGARRAGHSRGGRRAVAVAGSEAQHAAG